MPKKPYATPVQVTRASLPPLDDFLSHVREIFASRQLTNQGRLVLRLEQSLRDTLDVPALSVCSNGTIALQLALRLLGLNGKKVITTPFTYVATLSSLLWEGCTPIFADIDPRTLCLDPAEVERRLAEHPDTAGILPVHVFGNACDVEALADIARRHNLRVLYDAAHAFGSTLDGRSLFAWGDAAVGSFHATKLFHTVEGGCIVTHSAEDQERIGLLRAFGHRGDTHFCLGINGKMSELHAAMGLSLLPQLPEMLAGRRQRALIYDRELRLNEASPLRRPSLAAGLNWNHAYYPVIFPDHALLMHTVKALQAENIFPRRYFYPSLTQLPYVDCPPCPLADDMAERILCLPFWPDMEEELQIRIAACVRSVCDI